MTFLGCGLKCCTHTHTKHNVGSRCTKVKQEAHESLDGFCLIHAKLLENILSILGLPKKSPIFKLLDLKSKKEF
jgi:hypothetical protein